LILVDRDTVEPEHDLDHVSESFVGDRQADIRCALLDVGGFVT
jgi:hypothetical protein